MQIVQIFVFVFQEMDSIVDQMMTVAEYIGWETKELRPVNDLYTIQILDFERNYMIVP